MSGFLHFNTLEEDLYKLLSIINADRINQQMLSDSKVEPCLPHGVFPEPIVEDLLISAAVRIRMIEDRFHVREQEFKYPYVSHEVCRFTAGSPRSGDIAKSGLRLASDKIVHAKRVSFYDDRRYDVVHIDGETGKRIWQVEVNVLKFSIAGICLAAQYEENWKVSSRGGESILVVQVDSKEP